jgi:hypothetical protein
MESKQHVELAVIDKVEILTLQDNYIDLTVMDNNEIIQRALPIEDGQFRKSILSEHGFSALVRTTAGNRTHTLLFDTGFSEIGVWIWQRSRPLRFPTGTWTTQGASRPSWRRSPTRVFPWWSIQPFSGRRAI